MKRRLHIFFQFCDLLAGLAQCDNVLFSSVVISTVVVDNVGDWDDFDWGWKEDVQEGENEETELQCWLQECNISMSPVGDLIAVAAGDRIVHFTRQYMGNLF